MSKVNWDLFDKNAIALLYCSGDVSAISEEGLGRYLSSQYRVLAVKCGFEDVFYQKYSDLLLLEIEELEKDKHDLCKALAEKQKIIDGVE